MTTSSGDSSRHPGPNAWLLEEMREQFDHDPANLDDDSVTYFATGTSPTNGTVTPAANGAGAPTATPATNGTSAPAPAAPARAAAPAPSAPTAAPAPATAPAAAPAVAAETEEDDTPGQELRGASAAIVRNMEASLEVPTATSFRDVPAKMLEANRRVINGYLRRSNQGKVSFTHLIAWAVVRAVADHVPAMNTTFAENDEGKPHRVRHDGIGLGVAVDVRKSDGSRSLMVPTIRDAEHGSFKDFADAYDDLVARARINKLKLDDFGGTTVSITCLLYTSPSPRDATLSRMPSSA